MIKGEASDEEIDELEEAGALKDISHMPGKSEMCSAWMAYAGRGHLNRKIRTEKLFAFHEKKYHFTHLQFLKKLVIMNHS
mgnify:CR=1 FL=1